MRVLAGAVAALVLGACASEVDDPALGRAPARPVDPGAAESSVNDVLEADYAATFDESEKELTGLIVGPAALGEEMRLADLEVDDPNGNGRVDGRWYPPRLRIEDCGANVDVPPRPWALASFIPGDPDEELTGDPFDNAEALATAEHGLTIEIDLLDEPSQRDALADAMVELYEAMGDLDCDLGLDEPEFNDQDFADLMLGETSETTPHETGHPAVAFEVEGTLGDSLVQQYSVGDRVLLTVTVEIVFDPEDEHDVDPALAQLAIDSQLAHLDAAGLT